MKTVFFLIPVCVCIDAYMTIGRSMSCACKLINYTLATEENVGNVRVCACWYRFPNQTISNVCTRYIFQRVFRKNS